MGVKSPLVFGRDFFLKNAILTKGVKQQAVAIKRSVEDTFQPGIKKRVKNL